MPYERLFSVVIPRGGSIAVSLLRRSGVCVLRNLRLQAIRRTERHLARLKFFSFTSTLQQRQTGIAFDSLQAPQDRFTQSIAEQRNPHSAFLPGGRRTDAGAESCSHSNHAFASTAQNTQLLPEVDHIECNSTVEQTQSLALYPDIIVRIAPPGNRDSPPAGGASGGWTFPLNAGNGCTESRRMVNTNTERETVNAAAQQRHAATPVVAVAVPWKARVTHRASESARGKTNAKEDAGNSGCSRTESAVGHEERKSTNSSFGNFLLQPRYEEDFLIHR
ncbi:hypothetical protein TGMAS_262740B [Toxoplasma gondii MAS]|uniref:Uncharacterized protein n=1 Tax=Toxoplasma gondii MAS TaxID=943118 RepID=A0A086Q561_TOXGO|nr:hypothetical protein TGMAS_262740B [Toxoplasma gondii MAS]